jgi:hypothetical protein
MPEPPTRTHDGWLTEVTLEGADAPVRVVFMRREGPKVIVRQADPADVDPEPVPMWNGDQVIVTQALSHMSLNTTDEVRDVSGLMFGLRIVELRREPASQGSRRRPPAPRPAPYNA